MTTNASLLMLPLLGLGACAGPAAATPELALGSAAFVGARVVEAAPPVGRGTIRSVRPIDGTSAMRIDTAALPQKSERADEAIRIGPWREDAVYPLDTAPGQVSDIALQPGEHLISVAAGDTARWVIGDTLSGSGAAQRTHVLVKPSSAGLRTNLVIATDRRVYHVDLGSSARATARGLSWTYPHGALLALPTQREAAAAAPVAAVAVDRLNFNYSISGDQTGWRPLRTFDDGRQVFIEFPRDLGSGTAPPLFVLGAAGGPQLVNYRVRGRYYVVDRLFDAAELRLGTKPQKVVRITRESARREGSEGRP